MDFGRKVTHFVFAVLLALTLCAGAPNASSLPASAQDTNPLRAGEQAPTFTVRTVKDTEFNFDPAALERPVVLISFRGGWCPYCNMHLSELRTVIPDIRALGYEVLFISNDPVANLHAGLADQTREDIDGLDYTILSDAELNAAVAFGTAFQMAPEYTAKLREKGMDIEESSITRHNALAVPSVYVVSKSGEIVYDYVNADYKVRLSADELLAVAEAALKP